MKTLLLLILFIIIVPLLIGYLAGLSGKSKSDLVQLATMAGLLILFILYLVFINKEPKKKQRPAPSSTQSRNCNVTCIHDDYSIDEEERKEQHANGNEVYICDPAMGYPYERLINSPSDQR
ncbi:MAG: hypothetical protein D3925_01625 [Candidatus Electrothrix sp. AR5]|nr:hypothetical protein [Candidatus Electrothrix sp. AR5]